MLLNINIFIVWAKALVCSGHRMLSNMNVIMVWAWMLWLSHLLNHEHYYGFCMDALVWHSLKHDSPNGLGVNALVIGCSRT